MTSRELAESLLALSQAIEHAAQQADWPEAARLSERRSPLLMSLTGDVDDETLKLVRRVQKIDEAVLALATRGKSELEGGHFKAMNCAAATREYHRVARY
ncbi:protein FliT [Burkholderia sp. WP9]|uniref:flagellar protein FliT n=1 Tax=Burkholderia sp. WP9 TaxID=1500263 RepID=UPI00089BC469|nr:flagellar protein FliT [Burkholderia sp. WP9]SEF11032.1 protein FliT [Burkholderia sp. WP9]